MPKRRAVYDFGFIPDESPYHFAVRADAGGSGDIVIAEDYIWQPDEPASATKGSLLKAVLSIKRWQLVANPVAEVFNQRLRQDGIQAARWKARETVLAPHLGKELTLLAWAIEDAELPVVPRALDNWIGLAPEERWWLYTTINATFDHPEHGPNRGWRRAIKIAFAENPAAPPPLAFLRRDSPITGLPPGPESNSEPDADRPVPHRRHRQPAADQTALPLLETEQ